MSLNTHTTLIYHPVRKSLNITTLEYCFVDTILKLADNRDSKFPGWCYAKRQELANDFGITRPGLHKMITRLEKMGLIETSPKGHLRHSQKWYDSAVLNKNQIIIQSDVNKVDTDDNVNLVYRNRKLSLQSDVNKVDTDEQQSLQNKEQGNNREFEQGNNREKENSQSDFPNPFESVEEEVKRKLDSGEWVDNSKSAAQLADEVYLAITEKKKVPPSSARPPKKEKTGRKSHTVVETFETLKIKNQGAYLFFLNNPDIWDGVIRYRIEIKQDYASAESEAIAMVKFWKDAENNRDNAEAMIAKTVAGNYKGFFPADKPRQNGYNQPERGVNPYNYG